MVAILMPISLPVGLVDEDQKVQELSMSSVLEDWAAAASPLLAGFGG